MLDIEVIKNFLDKFLKLFHILDDQHDIKQLLTSELQVVVEQIEKDPQIPYQNKLLFLAQAYDARKTKNMVDIIKLALPHIKNDSNPQGVDDDWIADYFDKVAKIQSDDLKFIWSRILAEEINKPNSISKRLLHNLFLMSKKDAESFLNFSRFCFFDRYNNLVHPVIFIRNHQEIYSQYAITTENLKELENLFLIELNYDSGFAFKNKIFLMYSNHYIDLYSNNKKNKIPAGNVRLTADGQALFKMIEKRNSSKIFDLTVQKWRNRDCSVHINKY